MRIVLLIVLCFSLVQGPAFGASLQSAGDAEKLAVEFMTALQNSSINAAYGKMRPHMDITDDIFKVGTEKSIARHKAADERFGRTIGYEFVGGKMVGTSLLRLQFLELKERYVLRWSFHFFKTPRGWMLNNFTWEGDIENFFSP